MNIPSPLAPLTDRYSILLGSKSPRRKELLERICLPFRVVDISNVREEYPSTLLPPMVPQYLSNLKFEGYRQQLKQDDLLITADTVVINDNRILGKPSSELEARTMLVRLSGHTHQVVTGVTIGTMQRRIAFSVSTQVSFGPLTEQEIEYYISRFRPLDKAGAYGIQEWIGCVGVESIDGSFYNVMGLPLCRLYRELLRFL